VQTVKCIFLLLILILSSFFLKVEANDKNSTFNEAVFLIENNRFQEAVTLLEILYLTEKKPRIELELARAYYGKEEYKLSKKLFLKVKNNPETPPEVISKIDNFLQLIDNADPKKISFNFEFISERNPKKLPDNGIYNIFGFPIEYNEVKEKNVYGVKLDTFITKKINKENIIDIFIEIKDFESNLNDSEKIVLSHSYQYAKKNDFFTSFVGIDNSQVKNSFYGFRLDKELNIQGLKTIFTINTAKYDYKNYPFANGYDITGAITQVFDFFDYQNFRITSLFGSYLAKEDPYSNNHMGLFLEGINQFRTNRINLNYGMGIYGFKNKSNDPFWQMRRKGSIFEIFTSLCIDKKIFKSIDPCINFKYEKSNDKIKFYSYSNFLISLNFNY
tara:strand:- start:323 stop:1486 length:1164 start_codon:yes stop_codon:yes gene_type:complete